MNIQQYNQDMNSGKIKTLYQFGKQVLEPKDLTISTDEIRIKGWNYSVLL